MKQYIIDVGTSHNAPRSIELRNEYGYPVIFIEANKDALDKVPANNGDIKINAAITSYDGEVEFNYYQDGTHSILETNLEEIHKYIDGYSGTNATIENWTAWKKEKVKCYKLNSIIKELEIDEIAYLKIDTQGHDFEVIKSLEDKIGIVRYIECEVQITDFEIYRRQSKKEELLNFLIESNFELIHTEKQTHNQEENLIFENKKFLKMNEVDYIIGNKIFITKDSKVYNSHTWERNTVYQLDTIEFFYNQIIKNQCINIVDIGAQSGVFSLMAKFLPNTNWYAFEPDPINYNLCLENIILNNINNVKLYSDALSNKIGKDTFNICNSHRGLNTLGKNLLRFNESESQKIEVNLNTLDNLFIDTKIDMIKIDTEGAEYDILIGAENLIKKYKPKILLEYYDDNLLQFNKSIKDLNLLIEEYNYHIVWRSDDNVFIEPKNN
jgi:FkbM family methyltransferase